MAAVNCIVTRRIDHLIPKNPVLIVEDNIAAQNLLGKFFENHGIPYRVARDGGAALDLVAGQEFSFFLIDLMMPVLDGQALISRLKSQLDDPIILVQTALSDPQNIISVMRMAVCDYLVKPLDLELLQEAITRALELVRYREQSVAQAATMESRLKQAIDIASMKRYQYSLNFSQLGGGFVKNMKAALSEGFGPGAILPLIDLMKENHTIKDDEGIVNAELLQLLFDANGASHKLFQSMDRIYKVLEQPVEVKASREKDLFNLLEEEVRQMNQLVSQHEKEIGFSSNDIRASLNLDQNSLKLIIEELLVNAINYSPEKCNIDIFAYRKNKHFCITVKNEIDTSAIESLQSEMVFEPFYRVSGQKERAILFGKIGIGLGLGLSIVKTIMQKHNGGAHFSIGSDFAGNQTNRAAVVELFFPILDNV